jgi:hypothetical protein
MGWITKNLTTHTPGTPLAVYRPTAWLFAQYTRHVVFQGFTSIEGDDGHLYEMYCSASDDWHVKDLTTEAEGAGVATTANGYIQAATGSQHVVYQGLGFDGHVHELWYTSDDGWNANDLTNAAGAPLTGSKNIQISLYSAATAGTLLCTVGPGAITLNNGGFQIPLPDSCTAGVHANPDAWIEVFADGASLGRTKLGVVPYALEADHAATAAVTQTVNATVGGSLVGSPPAGTKFTWQAGTAVGTADASGRLNIAYPAAFPNGVVSVVVTNSYAQAASVTGILDHETAAGFTVVLGANQLVRINWMALGW